MLKQLLLLGLLALASAGKQYAYANANNYQGAFRCSDATKVFTVVIRNSAVTQRNWVISSRSTTNLVGGLWVFNQALNAGSARNLVDTLIKAMADNDGYMKTHYIVLNQISADTPQGVVAALKTLIIRGVQHGLEVGIYTSTDDWIRMTGNSTDLPVKVPLWWINDGGNFGSDTPDNFDDFVPFGPFDRSNLVMKQFSKKSSDECGCGKSVYFV